MPAQPIYTDRIPVVLDTDIGTDIDDTYAVAFLLNCPELDLKLITAATDNTVYRARLLAKLLDLAGRTEIPIGVGINPTGDTRDGFQAPFAAGYALTDYPGRVHHDGVDALIRVIMDSPVPVTLIAIGPLTNVAEALRREPRIARRARFVGMHGSLQRHQDNAPGAIKEYNVERDLAASRAVFTAPWEMTITPLDTCGCVRLEGEQFAALVASPNPVARAIMECHWLYLKATPPVAAESVGRTTILYDTVAVYLAFAHQFVTLEHLGVRVCDDGFTRVDPAAKRIACATEWKDLAGFKHLLLERLLQPRRAEM